MADFSPPWAASGTRRAPTTSEQTIGFQCGAADPTLFNYLFHRIQSEINAVIEGAGLTPSDDALDQMWQAITAYVAQQIEGLSTGEVDLSGYYTKTEADALFYTRGQVDALISGVLEQFANYYTIAEVDALLAAIRSLIRQPGILGVDSATTLTADYGGYLIQMSGATNYALTLPDPTGLAGTSFDVYNTGSEDKTIVTPAGVFMGPRGNRGTVQTLPRGANMRLRASSVNWSILDQSWMMRVVSTADSMTPADIGGYIQLGGGTTFIFNTIDPSAFSGARVQIYNAGSVAMTLSTPSGAFIGPGGSSASTLSLAAGENAELRAAFVNWIAVVS